MKSLGLNQLSESFNCSSIFLISKRIAVTCFVVSFCSVSIGFMYLSSAVSMAIIALLRWESISSSLRFESIVDLNNKNEWIYKMMFFDFLKFHTSFTYVIYTHHNKRHLHTTFTCQKMVSVNGRSHLVLWLPALFSIYPHSEPEFHFQRIRSTDWMYVSPWEHDVVYEIWWRHYVQTETRQQLDPKLVNWKRRRRLQHT